MPPPDDCIDAGSAEFKPEILAHCELVIDPATAPFPTPTGEPVIRFWFRLRDGAQPDPLALVLAVDVGPPTVFNLGKYGWAPTVELTVLLRGLPAPGWLLVESRSQTDRRTAGSTRKRRCGTRPAAWSRKRANSPSWAPADRDRSVVVWTTQRSRRRNASTLP